VERSDILFLVSFLPSCYHLDGQCGTITKELSWDSKPCHLFEYFISLGTKL
jgi:hypothetical protein